MENTSENKSIKHRKHISIALLAHVDAGKTTLSESILYLNGTIRKLGRVDNGDAFLDTFDLERSRGITIFSKQAVLSLGDMEVTLLDTPGHVDFSAEMERTLQVLDYAVLVISGSDGVQGHTLTLWRLLERYQIPVFLFVNKMDQNGTDREALLKELKKRLHEGCLDFGREQDREELLENLAMCEEDLLEQYLETGEIAREEIARLIGERKVFPCYFGSALKLTGVEDFLRGLDQYTRCPQYPAEFGAKIYKIARDAQGSRLTYMKITGGRLRVKDLLTNRRAAPADAAEMRAGGAGTRAAAPKEKLTVAGARDTEELWEEKVDQIRIYSGARYETVSVAESGTVCAVTGLTRTYPGQGLGVQAQSGAPVLEPVLNYQIQLPSGCDVHDMLIKLRQVEEEEPQMHIVWQEQVNEIHAQVMGQVQIEVLKSLILERFGVQVEFGAGNILYKETISGPVEGVGHYEPLRHYAEVHLLLEPGEPGSGLQFAADCSEDLLDRNWQRLVLTHLKEKEHRGVLTGSPITDMKITLIAGRAHLKHTEGGDFRQATYRAVRQGLKKADCILLEPYYDFQLEVPAESIGRAMADVQRMSGTFDPPRQEGETALLTGSAPVAAMGDYQTEVTAYTRGMGRLFCSMEGYRPCHNQEEVIAAAGYDWERDLDNPAGSVFCSHGAGFLVEWDRVEEYMHVESGLRLEELKPEEKMPEPVRPKASSSDFWKGEKELEEIYRRTYGANKREQAASHEPPGRRTGSSYKPPERRAEDSYEPPEKRRESSYEPPGRRRESSYEPPGKGAEPSSEPYRLGRLQKSRESKEYLLVDGYNIIFSWDSLKALAQANIDGARTKLMDILCNYQGFKKCTLILVFDAYKVEGHECEILNYHNIHVVYTKEAETADQYIERVVHAIGRSHQVTVATSDKLEQVIILGQGGRRLSAQGLKEEIELAGQEIRSQCRQSHGRRESDKNYLFDHLPEELADYMEDVRLGRREE